MVKDLGAVLSINCKEFCDRLVMSDWIWAHGFGPMDSGRERLDWGMASEGDILGLVLVNSHRNVD